MGKKFMGYNNASELITAIGNKIKAKYTKPSGGIPKSDLATAVQTSLGKADSALQSETDPTVPSWAKRTNKPSYTQDEVADGSTYKRVKQTEKNAWNEKQNALSTTQMQAVNSGITSEKVTQIAAITPNTTYNVAHNVTTSNAYELVSNLYVDVPSGKRVFITVGAKKSNPIGIAICTGNTYAGNIVVMQNEITSAQAMISVSGIYDNGDNNLTQRLYVFMKSQTSMAIQSRVTLSWWYI